MVNHGFYSCCPSFPLQVVSFNVIINHYVSLHVYSTIDILLCDETKRGFIRLLSFLQKGAFSVFVLFCFIVCFVVFLTFV